jgi:hypothetical protein
MSAVESVVNWYEKARGFLKLRQLAYLRALDPKTESGRLVLEDLAKFCRANSTTFLEDPRLSDVLVGRREVWLRIQEHLRLSEDQLWAIYGNKQLPPNQGE